MDWNARYKQNHTPWEKGAPTPVLAEMIERHRAIFHGRVLVPGCGLGHDARKIADLDCQVHAWDIAPLAIEKARGMKPESAVHFRVADFLTNHGGISFDLIWEHTCFCAIHPSQRKKYIDSTTKLLSSGGIFAGVFFLDPEMDTEEEGPPFGVNREELESMWREADFRILDAWTPAQTFPGRENRELAMILTK